MAFKLVDLEGMQDFRCHQHAGRRAQKHTISSTQVTGPLVLPAKKLRRLLIGRQICVTC
jgi:hypothetical protein